MRPARLCIAKGSKLFIELADAAVSAWYIVSLPNFGRRAGTCSLCKDHASSAEGGDASIPFERGRTTAEQIPVCLVEAIPRRIA